MVDIEELYYNYPDDVDWRTLNMCYYRINATLRTILKSYRIYFIIFSLAMYFTSCLSLLAS